MKTRYGVGAEHDSTSVVPSLSRLETPHLLSPQPNIKTTENIHGDFVHSPFPTMSLDPFSWLALVGVADVITRLGVGLRQLQQQYSGALDDVDNIAQQVGNIELAIREICSLLRSSPSTFPASFDTRLEESAAAIGKVVGQIQEHVQCVQAVSEKSANRGKIRHVWNSGKVTQWENNLGVQVQALSLLLQVAQM